MKSYLIRLSLMMILGVSIHHNSFAQVSGNIFRDFNADGNKTTTAPDPIEVGLKDVTINVYDASNTLFSATSDADGNYSILGGSAPYRVEFILPSGYYATNTNSSNSTLQFLATGGTASLGVNLPDDYCHTMNPRIYLPMYINGDNQVSGSSSATSDAILTLNYDKSGQVVNGTQSSTGAVWGTAYHRLSDKVFFAAFAKRHTNTGPLGLSGIYVTNTGSTASANTSTTSFVDLNAVNPAFYAGTVVRNFTSGGGDRSQANYDEVIFSQIGKIGLGDLDISQENNSLYVINLNDRKLWRVEIGAGGTAPTSASQITAYPSFPDPCTNSTFRPFAIEIHNGFVYVGGICDGVSIDETSVDRANLKATIYKADLSLAPSAATWSQVFEMPLTFNRDANLNQGGGAPASDRYTDPNGTDNSLSVSSWHPWARSAADVELEYTNNYYYPQPILSDIDFDIDGSIVLGFADRLGHQSGYNNFSTNVGSGSLIYSTGIGDIIRVHNDNGTFQLENNGTAGSITTGGANNGDGPSGGEYYYQDRFECCGLGNTGGPSVNHDETSVGGLALLAGKNEVLNTVFDAADSWESGGLRWYGNTTGEANNGLLLYGNDATDFFGKAHGLGDIELLCNPQPIEIGNRVFMDTDKDGEQDVNEAGIDGIIIKLFRAGVEVASTTTINGGQWFFTNLDPNTAYEVRILAADMPSGQVLTSTNTASNAKDLIDNDAALVGTDAVISYTTVSAGQNNHSLDFGFRAPSLGKPALRLRKTVSNSTATLGSQVTFTITVKNEGTGPASGVIVCDTLPTGLTYVSSTPSGYDASTHEWTIGAIAVGDSVTLTMVATVTQQGNFYNTAQVCDMVETDSLSIPGNSNPYEADIDRVCVSVPIELCPQDTVTAQLPGALSNIQWFKDTGAGPVLIPGANSSTYDITTVGTYTFTADEAGCPAEGCCPIVVIAGACAPSCPTVICLPVTVQRN